MDWWTPLLQALSPWLIALAPVPAPVDGGLPWALASLWALGRVASLPDACPADMTLVDGYFCPDLPLTCARPVDPANTYRCAEFVRENAQEMSPAVMQSHIDLYVNDYSIQADPKSIERLVSLGEERGLYPRSDKPIFAY